MKTIVVSTSTEEKLEAYKRYFTYDRKKMMKKAPFFWAALVLLGLLLAGLLTEHLRLLLIIGGFGLGIVFIWFLIIKVRYSNAYYRFEKKARKSEKFLAMNEYKISFDEEEIVYDQREVSSKIKWSYIKYYDINGFEIYLFSEYRALLSIISSKWTNDIIFDELVNLLKKKSICLKK